MVDKAKKRKKYRHLKITAIMLFLLGLTIALYPVISNWFYKVEVRQMEKTFEQQIVEFSDSMISFEKLYQELKRRNELLFAEKQKDLKDPFS